MLCKLIIVLLLLSFGSVLSFSQKTEAPKTSSASSDQKEREKQIRNQAVFLLKDNLLKSKSINNLRQRADVITDASSILWDYDRLVAEESLVTFIEQSLADYMDLSAKEKRTSEENTTIRNLDYALKKSLKALSQKDLKNGSFLRNKYFKIREDNLKAKDINEELELAADGLDIDEQRTLNLLTAVIQQRIPSQFPKLIFDLRSRNPGMAEILVGRAIQNLAANPNYKASDAIYLSVVIFNEKVMLIPALPDVTTPNRFGVYNSYLGSSRKSTTTENISSYFIAVQRFFNSRLMNQASGFFDSPQNLIQSYFLLEKLKSYDQIYRLIDPDIMDRILIPVTASMQTAGFSAQTISNVKGYAVRLASSNNPLGLDDGTNAFEKAENAKTPEEKLDYLISGIIQTIESGLFVKAERKIFDVQNSEIRDALYLYLHMRAGLDAIESKNWDEFENRTEKLTDKRIRAFLYLKAISVFESGKNADLLTEYVIKAEKNIGTISDKTAKASAQVVLTSSLLSLANTESMRDIPSAINSVNEAPDYVENAFEIRIIIPTRQGQYAEYIGANSFKDLFSKLARIDWTDSQVQALQVKRNGLQAIAQLATAKTVLQGKAWQR